MSDETTHEPPANPEIHFEPIVSLPKVEIKSLEENEEEIFQMRAKLYRYDKNGEESEWKERGVGVIRILKHTDKNTYRILMRRDKTLKICANHLITADMELKPNCGSDKAWVWSVAAEFADEECKSETLAIKFGNAENAKKFKDKFEECQKALDNKDSKSEEPESDKLAKELEGLNVKESKDTETVEEKKDTNEPSTSSKTEKDDKKDEKNDEEDVPEK
ncbi:ran-specific GTPase-activating protein-like [Actinia tenebrosa]|uniref:Ran-specific GTPase-activating protein-like n=1 Tax=Actinia tenebrosa TaxID=6105 RepID=A0A6P8HZZ7_ACTTE|nr:ran-specific GTPase-activating protein-like [Actinia tenebrosa]